MANVTVPVPDALTDDLVAAIVWALSVPPPTTAAAKATLIQDFMKRRAKEVLLDHRAFLAAQTARTNTADPATTW